MASVGYATLSILPSAKGFGSALSSAISPDIAGAGRKAGDGFMAAFSAKSVGAAAAAGAAIAGAIGGGLYAVGSVFDDMANTIQISSGASGAALDGLVESAKAVGTQVPVNFDAAADAIASLNTFTGASGEALEEMSAAVLDASRLLGEDGAANAAAFGQALTQFSRPAEDGAQIMDALYKVTQDYGLGLGETIGQLKTYGSVLQNAGFSMEESAVLLGQLNTAGIAVSRVMPGLNASFRRWAGEGKNLQEELSNAVDAIKNAETSTEALAIATDTFGAEGAQRLTAAIRAGRFELADLEGALADADGSIQESSALTRTFADNWTLLSNRVLDALSPLGTAVHDAVTEATTAFVESDTVEAVLDWVKRISHAAAGLSALFIGGDFTADLREAFGWEEDDEIVGRLLDLRDTIADVFASIGEVFSGVDLGEVFGVLGEILSPVLDAFDELGPTIAEVAGPVLEAVAAINPLGILLRALAPVLPTLAEAFAELAASLVGALEPIIPTIGEVAVILGQTLAQAFAIIGPIIAELVPVVGDLLVGAFAALQPLLEMLPDLLAILLPPILGLIPVVLEVVAAFLPFLDVLAGLVETLLPPLIDLILAVVPPVATLVGEIAEALVPILELLAGYIGDFVVPILGTLIGWIGSVIGIVVRLAGPIFGGLITAISTVIGWIGDIIGWVADFFSNLGNVGDAIGNFKDTILDGISNVVEWFTELPGRILDAISSLAGDLLEAGRNVIQGFIDGVKGMAGAVVDSIKSTITDALPGFVKRALGISSPSRLFRRFGQDTAAGMALGILDGAEDVHAAAERLVPEPPAFPSPGDDVVRGAPGSASGSGGPLIGHLSLQSSGNVREDLEEALFHIRRFGRGGAHA